MKPIHVADGILSVAEVKAHFSRVLRDLKETGRPVVITQNGKPAAVLITASEFDTLSERDRFVGAVERGFADLRSGRLLDDEESERELDARYGPLEE